MNYSYNNNNPGGEESEGVLMSDPVRLLYNVEFDPNFGNLPPGASELFSNILLYCSCVTHGHSGRYVSDHIHEHRSTSAHCAKVVDAQQHGRAGNFMRMGVGVGIRVRVGV